MKFSARLKPVVGPVAAHADLDRGTSCVALRSPSANARLSGTAIPDAPIPSPMITKMPATPMAAATTPASAGNNTWPSRLPVMRRVSAVP